MKNKLISRGLASVAALAIFASTISFNVPKAFGFDHNNLVADAAFVNVGAMDLNGVQNFLRSKGSFLANYSEGGRSAANIIYSAATSNRLNPVVMLAMLQKEQGLITGASAKSFNAGRMNAATGYGCPDSGGCDAKFKGFTKQVEGAAWQLRLNYDNWAGNGSIWNVGKTMLIDGKQVKFGNRSTSALYRYTPHLGTNFTYYFNLWNSGGSAPSGTLEAQYTGQGPRVGAGAPGVNLAPGQRFMIWVNYRNTGGATWYKAGKNMVRLGTTSPQDRGSAFAGGKSIRGSLVQPAVLPGQTGTFQMWLTAPKEGGTYTEKFQLVAEGIKWMGEPATYTFTVNGPKGSTQAVQQTVQQAVNGTSSSSQNFSASYNAQYQTQGPRVGAGSPATGLVRGQSATLWVNFRNTGSTTWYKTGYNAVHLGATDPQDRNSPFSGGRRGYLVQSSVKPGGIGTFLIPITAPKTPGAYVEKYRPVAEHITWMGDTVEWKLTVK